MWIKKREEIHVHAPRCIMYHRVSMKTDLYCFRLVAINQRLVTTEN